MIPASIASPVSLHQAFPVLRIGNFLHLCAAAVAKLVVIGDRSSTLGAGAAALRNRGRGCFCLGNLPSAGRAEGRGSRNFRAAGGARSNPFDLLDFLLVPGDLGQEIVDSLNGIAAFGKGIIFVSLIIGFSNNSIKLLDLLLFVRDHPVQPGDLCEVLGLLGDTLPSICQCFSKLFKKCH